MRERGIEVRPRRARDAFCMCEQTWARLTRDMVVVVLAPSRRGLWWELRFCKEVSVRQAEM